MEEDGATSPSWWEDGLKSSSSGSLSPMRRRDGQKSMKEAKAMRNRIIDFDDV
jgi:hypothetical protein